MNGKRLPAKLEPFFAATGETIIGFQRFDVPMVHELARARPMTVFRLEHDFDTCTVCTAHGVTSEMFSAFMIQ